MELIESKTDLSTESNTKLILEKSQDVTQPLIQVDENHELFTLSQNILTGLKLCLDDAEKTFLDLKSSPIKPNKAKHIKYNFKEYIFKDYCQMHFYELRQLFGISTSQFINILFNHKSTPYFYTFNTNSKSNSIFFLTKNNQFIIKSLSRSEVYFLLNILNDYILHISNQPHSLLPEFYGVYYIKTKKQKPTYFIITNNVFFSYSKSYFIHAFYDLKGSTQGRISSEEEKQKGYALKDLDWISSKRRLKVDKFTKDSLFKQIKIDNNFCKLNSIMDQSLLIGVHYLSKMDKSELMKQKKNNRKSFEARKTIDTNPFKYYENSLISDDFNELYFVGIIDMLQKYNKRKKLANTYKSIKYNGKTISTVPPDVYAQRLCKFVERQVL